MTEELKGSKSPPADDLQPGEERKPTGPNVGDLIMVRALVNGRNMDGTLQIAVGPQAALVNGVHVDTTSPVFPSEHSETAELEKDVVMYARDWAEVDSQLTRERLIGSVKALNAALAPPSLEEQIKVVFVQNEVINTPAAQQILALVKAHES